MATSGAVIFKELEYWNSDGSTNPRPPSVIGKLKRF